MRFTTTPSHDRVTFSQALAFTLTLALSLAQVSRAGTPHEDSQFDRHHAPVLSSDEVLDATGKSISEWGATWWQWAFTNPDVLGDTSGEFGPLGDVGGPVFFAEGSAGGSVTLSYTVPGGQYLLLPVSTYIWTLFDPCAEIYCARRIVNNNYIAGLTGVFARIDGVPVEMRSHLVRVAKNPLVFQVDAGPVDSDGYGGILSAEQGGYWLMLRPLCPGHHRITFGATAPVLDPDTGAPLGGTLASKTTLELIVEKSTHCERHQHC